MDVNLPWIQKIRGLEIEAIKGTENPADLGTKALTKEKIRKYMVVLGYEMEEGEVETWNQRKKGKSVSGAMVQKIARVVTMVLMCEVGECKVEETGTNRHVCSIMFMVAVTCGMVVFMCASTAFRLKAFAKATLGPKSKASGEMDKVEEMEKEEKPIAEEELEKEKEEKPTAEEEEEVEMEEESAQGEGESHQQVMEKRAKDRRKVQRSEGRWPWKGFSRRSKKVARKKKLRKMKARKKKNRLKMSQWS